MLRDSAVLKRELYCLGKPGRYPILCAIGNSRGGEQHTHELHLLSFRVEFVMSLMRSNNAVLRRSGSSNGGAMANRVIPGQVRGGLRHVRYWDRLMGRSSLLIKIVFLVDHVPLDHSPKYRRFVCRTQKDLS